MLSDKKMVYKNPFKMQRFENHNEKWIFNKACLSNSLGQEEISTMQVQYGILTWETLYGLWFTSVIEFR